MTQEESDTAVITVVYRWLIESPLRRLTLVLVLLAVFIDIYAAKNGLHTPLDPAFAPGAYRSFFQVPAWFPFPLYFILAALVIWQSWDAFNRAWMTLPKTGVLRMSSGREVDDDDEPRIMDSIIANFTWWRRWVLIPLAFISGFFSMYLDSERERATMLASVFNIEELRFAEPSDPYVGIQTTFSGQVARACEGPDFQSRWLWEELAKYKIIAVEACRLERCTSVACTEKRVLSSDSRSKQYAERVQNIIKLEKKAKRSDKYLETPRGQIVTEALMHFESMIVISLGWLIFLQCVAHALFFWNFERLRSAKAAGVCLKLNCESKLGEFGLEHWNHALNNLYWYFSGALLIPYLSRISQANLNDLDASQLVLQYAIPVLAATPMITTILARQNRLPECWDPNISDEYAKRYQSQHLWPLDKNWSSKLGIVLAFVLLSISFGISMTNLL